MWSQYWFVCSLLFDNFVLSLFTQFSHEVACKHNRMTEASCFHAGDVGHQDVQIEQLPFGGPLNTCNIWESAPVSTIIDKSISERFARRKRHLSRVQSRSPIFPFYQLFSTVLWNISRSLWTKNVWLHQQKFTQTLCVDINRCNVHAEQVLFPLTSSGRFTQLSTKHGPMSLHNPRQKLAVWPHKMGREGL